MSPCATYEDVSLILRLYEIRRDERLRDARRWFGKEFKPKTLKEFDKLCPPGSVENESFRMVVSYWDMAASFITTGVLQKDVFRAITKLEKDKLRYSLIFVDPPFGRGLVKKTLMRLDQSDIVAPFGQVVVGHSNREPLPESLEALKLARTKKIGQAYLSFLFRLESQDGETKSYISGEF